MFPPFDAGIFTAIVVMVAAADSVPAFNVEPFCHAVAMRAAPVGDKGACLRQEREARDQPVRQWSGFPSPMREACGRDRAGRWGRDRNNNVECIHWANR
jgi:hypothetical protein